MSPPIDLLAVLQADVVVEITPGPTPVADHRRERGLDTVVATDAAAAAAEVESGPVDLVVVTSPDEVGAAGGLLSEGGVVIVASPDSWGSNMSARYDHALHENHNLRERVISLTDIAERARWELETIKRSRSYRMLEPLRRRGGRRQEL